MSGARALPAALPAAGRLRAALPLPAPAAAYALRVMLAVGLAL